MFRHNCGNCLFEFNTAVCLFQACGVSSILHCEEAHHLDNFLASIRGSHQRCPVDGNLLLGVWFSVYCIDHYDYRGCILHTQ